jgi:uncharacterized lipoprotein NlpE involved in copper resistance
MTKTIVFILTLTTFLFACNNQQDKKKMEQANGTTDNLLDFGKRYAQASLITLLPFSQKMAHLPLTMGHLL